MSVPEIETNPYHPQSLANRTRFGSVRKVAVAAAFGIVLIALLLPFGYVSVFDGHFDLTIVVPTNDAFDHTSLRFAPCWTLQDARFAVANGSQGTASFYRGTATSPGTYVISVPYSGRSNAFGHVTSYNQARHLVVQYDLTGSATKTVRRQFLMPQGRGNRSMTVQVP